MPETTITPHPELTSRHRARTGGRAVALAVVLIAFLPTWWSFPLAWSNAFEHGFAVAALCGWLLWRDRVALAKVGPGLVLAQAAVGALSLLWLAAFVLDVQVIHQAVLPLLLLSWLVATAGVAPGRTAAPIAGVFLLAVPLWSVLTRPLQSLTVLANSALLSVARIEARIEGDFIAIPDGTFWVAEGCAGIDYFQIGLLVGVAYAMLFLRSWRARILTVITAIVCVVVMNWLRVFGLIVIGHVTAMQSPLMERHGTYGWILFGIAQVVFLAAARRIELAEGTAPSASTPVTAATAPASNGAVPLRRRPLIVATLLAVSGPVLHVVGSAVRTAGTADIATLTHLTPPANWLPDTTGVAIFTPAYRGADHSAQTRWRRGGTVVQVDRLVYLEQRQGKELIMFDNVIAADSLRIGEGETNPIGPQRLRATVTAVRTPAGARLVWSWFHVAGKATASSREAKLLELVAFLRRSPPSELVAVSTPCLRRDCQDAGGALLEFVTGSDLLRPAP